METYFATGDCYFEQNKPEFITRGANQFTIDDLLVAFPNENDVIMNDTFFDISSSNSSVSGGDAPLSSNMSSYSLSGDELCLPYDEMAELEWLSSFTEESFSTDDLHNLQLISAVNKTPVTDTSSSVTHNRISSPIFQNDFLVPGKIRSKRSRAAPCDWSSRLLLLQPSSSPTVGVNDPKPTTLKKTDGVRRCLHCGSDKTPQWRRGPMGPKTLCNACGVRFKSGRLVPEYRPAASPSFVPAQHSNSHRKVMELRRQMELRNSQQQQLTNRNSSLKDAMGVMST